MKKRIVILLTLLAFVFFVVGCDEQPAEEAAPEEITPEETTPEENGPEAVMQKYLDAMDAMDFEGSKEYIASSFIDEYSETMDMLSQLIDDPLFAGTYQVIQEIDYLDTKIVEHNIEGDTATVTISETSFDEDEAGLKVQEAILQKADDGVINIGEVTEEEAIDLTLELYGEVIEEIEKFEVERDIPMVKEAGEWKIADFVTSDMVAEDPAPQTDDKQENQVEREVSTFSEPDFDFTIKYPADWEYDILEEEHLVFFQAPFESEIIGMSIFVWSRDLEELRESNLEIAALEGDIVLDTKTGADWTINGQTYNYLKSLFDNDQFGYGFYSFMIDRGDGTVYEIRYEFQSESFDIADQKFDELLQSFRFE